MIVQTIDRHSTTFNQEEMIERLECHSSRRQDQVLRIDCAYDIHWRKPLGLKGSGVDVHGNDTLFSAVGKGKSCALHRGELCANEIVSEIEELLLAQAVAGQSDLNDGNSRRGEDGNEWRSGTRRKLPQNSLDNGGGLS